MVIGDVSLQNVYGCLQNGDVSLQNGDGCLQGFERWLQKREVAMAASITKQLPLSSPAGFNVSKNTIPRHFDQCPMSQRLTCCWSSRSARWTPWSTPITSSSLLLSPAWIVLYLTSLGRLVTSLKIRTRGKIWYIVWGEPSIFFFQPNLGFWPNQGGGGVWPKRFVKLAKTKFALVNGQKNDETHNT